MHVIQSLKDEPSVKTVKKLSGYIMSDRKVIKELYECTMRSQIVPAKFANDICVGNEKRNANLPDTSLKEIQ